MISFEDFKKLNIKIGEVKFAEKVPDTDKLLRLIVDVGEEEDRQIISGIAEHTNPEAIIGKKFPFIVNLEPRVIRGLESNGMILAVSSDGGAFSFLEPSSEISSGSNVR
jgi:methionine--tRNA ligase beta chain